MSNTPKLRFSGYANEWQKRKVQEISNRYDNLRVPVTANLRVSGTTPYYGANGIQDYVEGFTHDGEFVLVAEDGANDIKNYPVKCVNGKIWVNNHAHVLQAKPEIADNQFLAYSINQANIEAVLVGGSRAKLNAEALMDLELTIPSLQEQKDIGHYLENIDSLIALQQQKFEKLGYLKNAYLYKMFPRKGSNFPELRFSGFTSAWNWTKIGTVSKVSSASRVHKDEWTTEGVPFFRSSDVISAYKRTENTKAFISMALYEELVKTSGKLEKDDILITGGGSIGIPYIVPNDDPLYSKDADLIWIKNSPQLDSKYLYMYFACEAFKDYLCSISHVGTIAHYTIEQVKDTPVMLPDISEQKMIGEFFFALNGLIDMHKCKLEKLKQLKQAMLNNMFV